MPDLDDFRRLLRENADRAFTTYSPRIRGESLGDAPTTPGDTPYDHAWTVRVIFAYENIGGTHVIWMRAGANGEGKAVTPICRGSPPR
jgi:hypothetical protein